MITKSQRVHVDQLGAGAQVSQLSEALYYGTMICYKDITEDATAGLPVFSERIPWKIEIFGMLVLAKATVGGGTARLYDSAGNVISDAVVMATEDAATMAASLDVTYTTIAKSDQIFVRTNGATDRGTVGVIFRIIGD